MQGITIKYMQDYIKGKNIEIPNKEFLINKLFEEVDELKEAILKNPNKATLENFKGSVEEEICDVISVCLIIANSYDIDVEKWIPVKEKLHNTKWKNDVVFDPK